MLCLEIKEDITLSKLFTLKTRLSHFLESLVPRRVTTFASVVVTSEICHVLQNLKTKILNHFLVTEHFPEYLLQDLNTKMTCLVIEVISLSRYKYQ